MFYIFLKIVFLSAQLGCCICSDDPLQAINLTKYSDNDDPKPWFEYVHAFIMYRGLTLVDYEAHSTLVHCIIKMKEYLQTDKILTNNYWDTGYLSVFIPSCKLRYFHSCTYFHVTAPMFYLRLTQLHDIYLMEKRFLVLWKFKVSEVLRVKLVIDRMRIFRLEHKCATNVTIKTHELNEGPQFLFCGIYSGLALFLPTSNVQFYVFYWPSPSFIISVIFDTYSFNTTETLEFKEIVATRDININTHHLDIGFAEKRVDSYHIITDKYKSLLVNMTALKNTLIYDGLGLLSNLLTLRKDSIYTTSGFQCWIIITYTLLSNKGLTYQSLTNVGKWKKVEIDMNPYFFVYNFPDKLCFNDVCLGLILLNTTNQHLNVTVVDFKYTGDNGTNCNFGGIAFFNTKRSTSVYNEITTICTSRPLNWRNLQRIYSYSDQLVIVIYAYNHYSTIQVKLQAISTSCKPIRIDPCALQICERSHTTTECLMHYRDFFIYMPIGVLETPTLHPGYHFH